MTVHLPVSRFTICHKTEVIKNNLNPVWQQFTIPVRALCNGDYDRWATTCYHSPALFNPSILQYYNNTTWPLGGIHSFEWLRYSSLSRHQREQMFRGSNLVLCAGQNNASSRPCCQHQASAGVIGTNIEAIGNLLTHWWIQSSQLLSLPSEIAAVLPLVLLVFIV